jgi:hypothetical protein
MTITKLTDSQTNMVARRLDIRNEMFNVLKGNHVQEFYNHWKYLPKMKSK